MSSSSYEKAIASLEPTAASLVSVSEVLLRAHALDAGAGEPLSAGTSRRWFEKTAKFVLNWLALGKNDILREVREGLRRCIGERPAHRDFLARLTTEERTLLRAVFLEEFLSTYDFSFNRARFNELLGGARRQDWRRALIQFQRARRSLAVSDLNGEVFQNRNTADHALLELEKMNLVQRDPDCPPSRKLYVLTPLGRAAASMAREIEAESGTEPGGGLPLYEQPKHQPAGVGIVLENSDRPGFLG